MKVLICETAEKAVARAAELVIAQVRKKPGAVLGLATGGTMLPLYRKLCDACRQGAVSFAQSTTFNLDEYVGLAPDHPGSYHSYMREIFFDHTDIDLTRTHLPRGDCADPASECQRYEARVATSGGIDLQLLGIGQNGHIGFNEPTSSLGSRTRIKTLSHSTRLANAGHFGAIDAMPRYALTMGIGTILDARQCILLATGRSKATAVASMIEGPVSAVCPASALQLHPAMTAVLDAEAASDLALTDYYHHVHPLGEASSWE